MKKTRRKKSLRRNSKCKRCKLHETAEYVNLMGEGFLEADLILVGEAPGHREDDIGKPFQGKSGKLLESVMKELGISREDIFITNAVKCRPPKNRTPKMDELMACSRYLDKEIKEVHPRVILTLGAIASLAFLGGRAVPITTIRGRKYKRGSSIVIPTLHPAFVLRNQSWLKKFKRDLRVAWITANSS